MYPRIFTNICHSSKVYCAFPEHLEKNFKTTSGNTVTVQVKTRGCFLKTGNHSAQRSIIYLAVLKVFIYKLF